MMKKRTLITLTLLAALTGLLALHTGCFLWGTSMEDRLSQFVDALNDGQSNNNIDEHIHPDANDYNALKDESALDNSSLDVGTNGPFSTSSISVGQNAIDGTWKSANADETFFAWMKEDGMGNWKILSFDISGTTIFD